MGAIALASLLSDSASSSPAPSSQSPVPARVKRVIWLFMHGGPSHVDLLDPKPALEKFDGKPPPAEVADDEKLTGNLLRSPFKFAPAGKSGTPFSEATYRRVAWTP